MNTAKKSKKSFKATYCSRPRESAVRLKPSGVWVSPKFRSCRLRLCRDGFAQFEPGAVLPPCALFPRVHAGWGISSQPLLGLAFPNGTRRIWFLEVCGGGRGGELRWSGPREGGSRMSQAQLRSPGEWGSETSAIPNMNTKTLRVLFAKCTNGYPDHIFWPVATRWRKRTWIALRHRDDSLAQRTRR